MENVIVNLTEEGLKTDLLEVDLNQKSIIELSSEDLGYVAGAGNHME